MTVQELMDQLRKLPPDLEVCGTDSEYYDWPVTHARVVDEPYDNTKKYVLLSWA